MNYSEEEVAELEQQYQDLDPKLIQIEILMELRAIRMAVSEPREGEPESLTCSMCGEEVLKSEREQHAEKHNTPPDMVADLYQ